MDKGVGFRNSDRAHTGRVPFDAASEAQGKLTHQQGLSESRGVAEVGFRPRTAFARLDSLLDPDKGRPHETGPRRFSDRDNGRVGRGQRPLPVHPARPAPPNGHWN